jgi:hypothetical protein
VAGIAGDNTAGTVVVPTGSEECVVQPARVIAAMQMTRSVIAFGSMQEPSLSDLINKMLTAIFFYIMQPPARTVPEFCGGCYLTFCITVNRYHKGIFIKPYIEWMI